MARTGGPDVPDQRSVWERLADRRGEVDPRELSCGRGRRGRCRGRRRPGSRSRRRPAPRRAAADAVDRSAQVVRRQSCALDADSLTRAGVRAAGSASFAPSTKATTQAKPEDREAGAAERDRDRPRLARGVELPVRSVAPRRLGGLGRPGPRCPLAQRPRQLEGLEPLAQDRVDERELGRDGSQAVVRRYRHGAHSPPIGAVTVSLKRVFRPARAPPWGRAVPPAGRTPAGPASGENGNGAALGPPRFRPSGAPARLAGELRPARRGGLDLDRHVRVVGGLDLLRRWARCRSRPRCS